MNDREKSIQDLLESFTILEQSINRVDPPGMLNAHINRITSGLKEVNATGRGMDEQSLFPVPVDMLTFLDEVDSNPEMYRCETCQRSDLKAKTIAERLYYLQSIKAKAEIMEKEEVVASNDDGGEKK